MNANHKKTDFKSDFKLLMLLKYSECFESMCFFSYPINYNLIQHILIVSHIEGIAKCKLAQL